MDSKRNFKLDSSQYRTCLSYLNAVLISWVQISKSKLDFIKTAF